MTAATAVPTTAMILCAGLGTRMRPLTDTQPKPLIEVAGTALIDRALAECRAAGVRRAVVNLHYLGDMIRTHLANVDNPEVLFSDESNELLETGGGIAKARPLLGDAPVFTLNPDAVWAGPPALRYLAAAWEAGGHAQDEGGARTDALLLLVAKTSTVSYSRPGDFFLEADVPRRRGQAASAPFVYTGAQIIRPNAFADCPDGPFSLNLVWDRLLSAGRLRATVYEGTWVDVGTPAGIPAAEAALRTTAVSGRPG